MESGTADAYGNINAWVASNAYGNATNAYGNGSGNASNINGAGDRHRYYDYGISIPGGCDIAGIEVRLDWWLDKTNSTNSSRPIEPPQLNAR